MNSVENLLSKPFKDLSLKEKVEIKKLGPDQRDVEIIQQPMTKGQVNPSKRHFNRQWFAKAPWLCGCPQKKALFCFPCLLFGDEPSWTKIGVTDMKHLSDKIKHHEASQGHIISCTDLAMLGKDLKTHLDLEHKIDIRCHNEKVDKNRNLLSKIIDCIKFCGKFSLPLGGDEVSKSDSIFLGLFKFAMEFDNILKFQLKSTSVFQDISEDVQNELLDCMFIVYREHVLKEIQEADFCALSCDEVSDSLTKLQVVFIYRYVLPDANLVERFWGFYNSSNEFIEKRILSEVDRMFQDYPEKLIAQTYDGTLTANPSNSGVQHMVKDEYETAHYVDYYAHDLNLIIKQATNNISEVRFFFAHLSGFSAFFDGSKAQQRIAILESVLLRKFPGCPQVMWNFNNKTVCTVYEHKDSIIQCIEEITSSGDFDSTTLNEASALFTHLHSDEFLFWLEHFNGIISHLDILCSQVRKQNPNNILMRQSINDFVSAVTEIGEDAMMGMSIANEVNDICNRRKRRVISNSERHVIAKQVCDIIITNIIERFAFNEHLIASKFFYLENYLQYSFNFPNNELKLTVDSYPFLDQNKLRTELKTIYTNDCLKDIEGVLPLLRFFMKNNLQDVYSETVKLLKVLATTPMYTLEPERCFSTLKKVKKFVKSTVNESRLNALTMLAVEYDFVKGLANFNNLVIDKFSNLEHRKLDFLHK